MKNLPLTLCVLMMACGSSPSDATSKNQNVTGDEAEAHCRDWCTGCGRVEEECRLSCRSNLAQTCGAHRRDYQDCLTALDCTDEFLDCYVHRDAQGECSQAIQTICSECDTNEGRLACQTFVGECDRTIEEARCQFLIDAGHCGFSLAECVAGDSCVAP